MTGFIDALKKHDACPPAMEWFEAEGITTLDDAWRRCPRGEWLLWLAGEAGVQPPKSWTTHEIVAPAFNYAIQALDARGVKHDLVQHQAALERATEGDVEGVLGAAWCAAAADDAAGAARAAEHARCAAAVRALWPEPPNEVCAMFGGAQ